MARRRPPAGRSIGEPSATRTVSLPLGFLEVVVEDFDRVGDDVVAGTDGLHALEFATEVAVVVSLAEATCKLPDFLVDLWLDGGVLSAYHSEHEAHAEQGAADFALCTHTGSEAHGEAGGGDAAEAGVVVEGEEDALRAVVAAAMEQRGAYFSFL